MRRRATPPPVWFYAAVALVWAVGLRALEAYFHGHPTGAVDAPIVQLAWWQFVVGLVGLIWDGVQVAYHAIVVALQWSVKFLWTFATATYNALIKFGKLIGKGLRASWEFLRATYEKVLKPAWEKLHALYDRVRKWLDKWVAPVLRFLQDVRRRFLKFYEDWIRPILDTIDVSRRILQLLGRFGVEWAKTLDQKLGDVEGYIDRIYRRVLGELNQVINLIDSIVTGNGLFQRLPFVRTLQRDVRYVWSAWWKHIATRESERQREPAPEYTPRTTEEHAAEFNAFLRSNGGDDLGFAREHAADLSLWFRRHPIRLD